MYTILVYDINQKRVAKVLKIARKYLHWVQNSVLEGDITKQHYKMMHKELSMIIDKNEDSCLFYIFRTKKYHKRECLGKQKGSDNNII